MQFFEKCLDVAKRANDKDNEAICYQQIALIQEKVNGDNHEKAIEYLQKFLELGIENNNKENQREAHKMLADIYSRNGQVPMAFQHLESVLEIAIANDTKSAEAEAALKLGLLYNKEGKERNIKKSSEYL